MPAAHQSIAFYSVDIDQIWPQIITVHESTAAAAAITMQQIRFINGVSAINASINQSGLNAVYKTLVDSFTGYMSDKDDIAGLESIFLNLIAVTLANNDLNYFGNLLPYLDGNLLNANLGGNLGFAHFTDTAAKIGYFFLLADLENIFSDAATIRAFTTYNQFSAYLKSKASQTQVFVLDFTFNNNTLTATQSTAPQPSVAKLKARAQAGTPVPISVPIITTGEMIGICAVTIMAPPVGWLGAIRCSLLVGADAAAWQAYFDGYQLPDVSDLQQQAIQLLTTPLTVNLPPKPPGPAPMPHNEGPVPPADGHPPHPGAIPGPGPGDGQNPGSDPGTIVGQIPGNDPGGPGQIAGPIPVPGGSDPGPQPGGSDPGPQPGGNDPGPGDPGGDGGDGGDGGGDGGDGGGFFIEPRQSFIGKWISKFLSIFK